MANTKVVHTKRTYGALVAARLRELRVSRNWSIEDVQLKLAAVGCSKPVTTLYSYEQGKDCGGANLPVNLYPAIARLFGFPTPHSWLPDEFPIDTSSESSSISKLLFDATKDRLNHESLNSLAKKAHISQPVLHRWVNGERSINISTADKLAKFLGLTLVGIQLEIEAVNNLPEH